MTAALTAVGWVDLAATTTLAGGLAYGTLVGAPSDAGLRALRAAAVVLAFALLVEFGLTALRMQQVAGVSGLRLLVDLVAAQWGRLWIVRWIGLAAIAVGLGARRASWSLLAALAAAWLLARSWQGHAGAHGAVPALIDWLHLLAAATWIGSLVQLALLPRPTPGPVARRTRTLATIALAVLIPAGVYAAVIHVQRFDMLIGSPYGEALLAKLGLTAVLLSLGVVNHFRHVPAMLRGEAAAPARLSQAVRASLGVAALVLLATALLGVLPMPHGDAP